ncbi:MAG: helix-turn-helix transcriptional regulator [Saprospiraceae bacterium]
MNYRIRGHNLAKMVYPIQADIVSFLRKLTELTQPLAKANFVGLQFDSGLDSLEYRFQPELLVEDLNRLLCRVIAHTPQYHHVALQLIPADPLLVRIRNTGPYLGYLTNIPEGIRHPHRVASANEGSSFFEVAIPAMPAFRERLGAQEKYADPPLYQKLRRRLLNYSPNLSMLEEDARARSERDGVFLQKINALLLSNLDRESFDVTSLCRGMALSRAQLYRRIIPLVHLPPSQYIRYFRMVKAKEFLDAGEWTIGEIGFRVGFKDKSHFTRVFKKHFGHSPSRLRKKQPH